ncbi:MAG: pyridoxal phosphate-dependent aminotransferase [Paludibacteraceae bacterium]|jgi:aspartate aminotransferase|nr:pyridoxal phosphate-dependent aminotransferase [Paludibacteraceae bacterium]
MKISTRAQNMPESPIRKLAKYAEAAHRNGVHVYSLNIGQPDIQTPDCAKDAITNFSKDILAYTPSQGVISLRAKMVGYYAEYGIDISPDEIIITSGGSEAIMFAYMACLNPGDEIIITDPSYANYMAFAVSCGAVIKPVKTNIENGFKLPSVEEFEKQITEKTRAILICNPNNPTGYLYTKQEMLQIRDLVKKYNLYLFSDEVYREFIYTKRPYISAFHLEGIEDHVVLIDSVSKRYSLCGIRIGALITKNKQIHSAVMKFCQARLSPPLIGQVIAESSLATPHEYLEEVYDEYLSRRNFLIDQLNQIPGVFAPTPMGAFYVMVHLPVDDTDKFCQWCLTDFQYEGQTVIMAPGSGFYTNPEDGRHQVRMAYILNKEDLAKAVLVLRKALEAYQNEKQ